MGRRTLALVVIGLALVGSVGLFFVFTNSLWPSERARSYPGSLTVDDLGLGSYRTYDGRGSRLFVVRTVADAVYALVVPIHGDKVVMPDIHWWQPLYDCTDFSPGARDASLPADAIFTCRDPGTPEWWVSRWRWHLDGTSATGAPDVYIEEMHRIRIERAGGTIYVLKWDYPGVV